MSEVKRTEEEITREGNPRKPQGEEGKVMLDRMNRSHYEVTGCPFGITDLGTADHYICAGITDTDDHIFKSLCRQ